MKIDHRRLKRGWHTNVLCRDCGMVFSAPRPPARVYEDFYRHEYTSAVYGLSDDPKKIQEIFAWRTRRSLEKIGYFPKLWKKGMNVLEVGAGIGAFLMALRKRFGCRVFAVEPAPSFVALGRAQGKLLYAPSTFEEFLRKPPTAFPRKYDAIVLDQMLEHALDPVTFLMALQSLLKPEGFLFISVPNIAAPKDQRASFFIFEHVSSFSPYPLATLLLRCGYKVVGMHAEAPGSLQIVAAPFRSTRPMVHPAVIGQPLTAPDIRRGFAALE
ncbi:MAG: class I SAM-dependent methyltransferase [Patescibacteria group bacterium]